MWQFVTQLFSLKEMFEDWFKANLKFELESKLNLRQKIIAEVITLQTSMYANL